MNLVHGNLQLKDHTSIGQVTTRGRMQISGRFINPGKMEFIVQNIIAQQALKNSNLIVGDIIHKVIAVEFM
jgi:hypothetical protein